MAADPLIARVMRSSTFKVQHFLRDAIRHLGESVEPDAVLNPALQQAIRILESRIRVLERLYLAAAEPDSMAAMRARTELNLSHPDDGTLVQIGVKRHGRGRLDCRACDVDLFGMILAPATRLCSCLDGIQHAYTRNLDLEEPENPERPLASSESVQNRPGANEIVKVGKRQAVWECETCHRIDLRPEAGEEEEKKC